MRFSLIQSAQEQEHLAMIVCHCLAITDRDLKRAASGNSVGKGVTPPQLAGTCCGGCKPMVQKILQSYRAKKSAQESGKPAK